MRTGGARLVSVYDVPEPLPASVRAAALLGSKVRAVREARGMTQEQLADRAGISRNQVQNIEHSRNNTRSPDTGRPGPGNARLDTVFRLAFSLEVDITYLVDPDRPVIPVPGHAHDDRVPSW